MKESTVPVEVQAIRIPEQDWTFRRTEQTLVSVIETEQKLLLRPADSLVAIATTISQLTVHITDYIN